MISEDEAFQRLQLLHSLRRYRDLEAYARECIASHPEWGVPYSYLSQALAERKRPADGIHPAKIGVGKCPHDPWAHAVLAFVLLRARKYERALYAAEEALRLDPNYIWAYALLVNAERNLREYRSAARTADRGLRLSPNDENLLTELGWSLIELGEIDEAKEVAERGLEQHPSSYTLHNVAGWICHLQATRTSIPSLRSYRLAEQHFAQAVRLNPMDFASRENREQNAIAVRKYALTYALLVGALVVGLQFVLAFVALESNPKFASMLYFVLPQAVWLGVAAVWVSQTRIVLLSAPLDRFDIPAIPLSPAERSAGRMEWGIILLVELVLILTVVGAGLYPVCFR